MTEFVLCATGIPLLRQSIRAIDPAMRELIEGAKRELQIAAYLLMDAGGDLLGMIESAAQRGIKTTIVVNKMDEHPFRVREWALRMNRIYAHADVRDYQDTRGGQLHAKVVVSDRSRAIVGSANLTTSGMNWNIELGVIVTGEAAWDIAMLVDEIAGRARSFRPNE